MESTIAGGHGQSPFASNYTHCCHCVQSINLHTYFLPGNKDPWQDRDSKVSKNVRKDLCLNPVSAEDEFDRLLAKVIQISTTKSKVRGSIRHNTEDVGIEAGTPGNN